MEVSFDGNPQQCIIFFLEVKELVFYDSFSKWLTLVFVTIMFHLSMEIIFARTQSTLQTLINRTCIGKDHYIPILLQERK